MTSQPDLPDNARVFLAPTEFVDAGSPIVKRVVRSLKLPKNDLRLRAIKLFNYVRDKIRYDPFDAMLDREHFLASAVLERGAGFCVQKAVVLAALARAAGVPCKLCFADIRSHVIPQDLLDIMGTDIFTFHGFNALYCGRGWVKATPTFDRAICEAAGFALVEFNGVFDAVLPPFTLSGQRHIEYMREIGCFHDLPFENMREAFERFYLKDNSKALEAWKARRKKLLKEKEASPPAPEAE
jgi:transglutaminase-like putative cysteine protease